MTEPRGQQMARTPREAVKLPDQHAVDFMVSDCRHQGIELRAASPTAGHANITVIPDNIEAGMHRVGVRPIIL